MIHRLMKFLGFIVIGLALAANAGAAPGQRYDVRNNGTKVYAAANAKARVITRLNKGDRVIEWRRQGSWVQISKMGTVGVDGWVQISRLRTEASEIVIKRAANGHFVLPVMVNGQAITFLVDTGASVVVLRPEDAKKLGFEERQLNYSQRVLTASGITYVAPVNLEEIRIGHLTVSNITAAVSKETMSIAVSLLGMSFLGRLRSYEVVGDRLILRW